MLFDNVHSFYYRTSVEVSTSYNNRYEKLSVAMPQIRTNKCSSNFKWNKVFRANILYSHSVFYAVNTVSLRNFIIVFINYLFCM